jgi:hypothetical protein
MLLTTSSTSWYSSRGFFKLVAYLFAVIVSACVTCWHKRKERIALDWPSVEGCVQFVNVAPVADSSDYAATLDYSYFVEEYRSGRYSQVFSSEDEADDFTKTMRDKNVLIHYNPLKPDDSVLEESDVEQQIQSAHSLA